MRLSYIKNENNEAEAISSNDYYPFGLNHINVRGKTGVPPVYSSAVTFENWKYNGKELEETGMYDYGARFYMPDIGRFGMYDPLAEKTMEPYSYVYNNPVRMIDPTGMEGESVETDANGNETISVIGNIKISAGTAAVSVTRYGDNANTNSKKSSDAKTKSASEKNMHDKATSALGDYSLEKPTDTNSTFNFSFNKSPNDIIIYLATKGAGGLGHMGTGIGNDNDGWIYISKDGRANGTLGKGGDSKFTIMTFKTNNQMNQYIKSLDYNYNEMTRFSTNSSQDYRAATSAVYNAMSGYHAKDNNCSAVTNAAMYSAGFRVGISSIPNISYYELRFWNSDSIKK